MRALFVIVSFLALSITSQGQQRPIKIIGEILESGTKKAVPFVHIVNKKTSEGTVSNRSGRFWISMEQTDTLIFSSIGYEQLIFTLKESNQSNQLVISIEMNPSTLQLKPVKVFAFKDEASLKRALVETKVPLLESKEIQLPGFYYGPRKEPKSVRVSPLQSDAFGVGISGVISKLTKSFSKEEKEYKRLKDYQKQADYSKIIKAKYNAELIVELTGLPPDRVDEFIDFCQIKESFILEASAYEIAVAVTKCHSEFLKLDKN